MGNRWVILGVLLAMAGVSFAFHLYWRQWPAEWTNQPLWVTGEVIQVISVGDRNETVQFRIRTLGPHPWDVLLNHYYPAFSLQRGEVWRLRVKLVPLHGLSNPGTLDRRYRLMAQGYSAMGSVLKGEAIRLSPAPPSYLEKRRAYLNQVIDHSSAAPNAPPFLKALLLGDDHVLNQTQWTVLRNTGTSHLVAISGLHLVLLMMAAYHLVRFFLKVVNAFSPRSLKPLALAVGLVLVWLYGIFTGFSPPAQRALMMISIYSLGVMWYRSLFQYWGLAMAFCAMLIIEPFSVFSAGFWLSFYGVFLLMYGGNYFSLTKETSDSLFRTKLKEAWQLLRLQTFLFFSLTPLTAYFFQMISFISIVTNLVAVPFINGVALPGVLISGITALINESLGEKEFHYLNALVEKAWWGLERVSYWPWDTAPFYIPALWVLVLSLLGICCVFSHKPWWWRSGGALACLPLFFYTPVSVKPGTVLFTVLDVGQGLAVVVQTANHVLVYDTGPQSPSGWDAGKGVILPFLGYAHLHAMDKLIISHGDLDHRGGALSLLERWPEVPLLTSVPQRFRRFHAQYCREGQGWEWEGVHFEMLYPFKVARYQGNNSSCVMKITVGKGSVLLTGDIEKPVEAQLVEREAAILHATILVAPHHGSRTSSSQAFLRAVSPRVVLFSTGYYNRYHLPHPTVLKRYEKEGIRAYNTAFQGALRVRLQRDGTLTIRPWHETYSF